jgi:hypothetical protein
MPDPPSSAASYRRAHGTPTSENRLCGCHLEQNRADSHRIGLVQKEIKMQAPMAEIEALNELVLNHLSDSCAQRFHRKGLRHDLHAGI